MTGFKSKKAAAQAKLQCQCSMTTRLVGSGCQYCNPQYLDDDDVQPAQEPVAHFGSAYVNENGVHITTVLGPVAIPQDAKLYTTPPQRPWVSLTDDQIKEIVGPWGDTPIKGYTRKLIDQIDAKLRENNT